MAKNSNPSTTFTRAIVVNLAEADDSVGDHTLRAWLEAAPRIGTLP